MKKGISLVALVITIIVLIILTAAVILTATNSNIFGKSEEAVFKSDVTGFQEELTKSILEEQLKDNTFDSSTINTTGANADPITKWIPSIAGTKYEGLFKIDGGKLVYTGEDTKQIEYVQTIGIIASSIGSDILSISEKQKITASQISINDEIMVTAKSNIVSNPFNGLIAGKTARATILFSNGKEITLKAAFDVSGDKDYVIIGTGEWPDESFSAEDPLYLYFDENSNLGGFDISSGWSTLSEFSNEGVNQCSAEEVGFTSTVTSIALNGNDISLFDNFFEFYK